jgi:predicted SAM-dependent methyltransferase
MLPFFKGKGHVCNCCGIELKKFVGDKGNNFGACPNCHSGSRHRFRDYFLKQNENLLKNSKVLHFAPEICSIPFFESKQLDQYIKADFNSPFADERIDMTNIAYPADSFDLILTSHVLEHIDDDIKAMSELYRTVKPGGLVINQIPQDLNREKTYEDKSITTRQGREEHFGHIDHRRIYGIDFKKRLEQVGFQVDVLNSSDNMEEDLRRKYGINKNEIIYLCYKS